MKPTIGRIVHYTAPVSHQCCAAVITSVISDIDISLYVLDYHRQAAFFTTSTLDAHGEDCGDHLDATWHWPERAGEKS